ncbi:UDP-2,3-diacylglucosamine diphosphatase [Campylobacter sp. 2457A]|uniref:UDP-2,3-diacylglucosamine diphosphatase n=1 Tax=Campylobacter sp. 2457A TaxID=2735784 RepID=UPI00301C8FEA
MQELILQNKAILIADAHENTQRRGFWKFLQALKNDEISTPQLILMGDIFDLLIGEISATHEFAKPYIYLLEELAQKIEIIYLEGNHDFNLSYFFEKVKIFSLEKQPLKLKLHTSKVKNENSYIFLAHGDIFLSPCLQFALKSLRNHYLLVFLNWINQISFHAISKKILKNQNRKNLFYKIKNFENLANERYLKYRNLGSWVCEGHYHQNFIINKKDIKYFNPDSFAHKESFFLVEYKQEIEFREQKLRGQNV